jgi:hypothetical protein
MIRPLEPNTALRGISPVGRAILKGRADSRTPSALILGAGQLWIPESVSARPEMPDAGFIAPAPVATWLQDIAPRRAA